MPQPRKPGRRKATPPVRVQTVGLAREVRRALSPYAREVNQALRHLARDLHTPTIKNPSLADKLRLGGAVPLVSVGEPLHPAAAANWLAHEEIPVLATISGELRIVSGGHVLHRAAGAGMREVPVLVEGLGRVNMRLSQSITRAQVSAALWALPPAPSPAGAQLAAGRSARRLGQKLPARAGETPTAFVPPVRAEVLRGAERIRTRAAAALTKHAEENVGAYDSARRVPRGVDIEDTTAKEVTRAERETTRKAAEQASADTRRAHENLGLKRYIWITSRDDRTRPCHARLDGTVQEYANPPLAEDGIDKPENHYNPGEKHNCRCSGSPVMEDLEAALSGE